VQVQVRQKQADKKRLALRVGIKGSAERAKRVIQKRVMKMAEPRYETARARRQDVLSHRAFLTISDIKLIESQALVRLATQLDIN
jgi:hypothetical protein